MPTKLGPSFGNINDILGRKNLKLIKLIMGMQASQCPTLISSISKRNVLLKLGEMHFICAIHPKVNDNRKLCNYIIHS